MRVIGLISGGKDSCFNLVHCVAAGHEIVALANLKPKDNKVDELDSQMYQTVGTSAAEYIAKAMDLPLFIGNISGTGNSTGRDYLPTEGDEVEDLYDLLKKVSEETGAQGVSVGAILSDYQRVRVESVCLRLSLTPLAYLWRRNQAELLREMISCKMECILIKVACLGLDSTHLEQTLNSMEPTLLKLEKKFGVNVCGEGGEYETYTLDSPLFIKKLKLVKRTVVNHTTDPIAPVSYLHLDELERVDKDVPEGLSQQQRLDYYGIKGLEPESYLEDLQHTNICSTDSSSTADRLVIEKKQPVISSNFGGKSFR